MAHTSWASKQQIVVSYLTSTVKLFNLGNFEEEPTGTKRNGAERSHKKSGNKVHGSKQQWAAFGAHDASVLTPKDEEKPKRLYRSLTHAPSPPDPDPSDKREKPTQK